MERRRTIVSLEQALALPYATQRFAQLGWRVVRIEAPADGTGNAGDPNRYIGADLGHADLRSYFIAPNVGKEAITLDLKRPQGQELLQRIIRALDAEVFMCNTLPKRYAQLGIGFERLRAARPGLIWCGISAMGPGHPDRAGYDPALQALMGFTHLTGEPGGRPVPCGVPIIDLKAGDEAFTQVLLALMDAPADGREIHISMARCAASWLITALPHLAFSDGNDQALQRSGNEHRSFIPCNAYPTRDGFAYLAIGNDGQWARFTRQPGFERLATDARRTNAGRMKEKERIYEEIGAISRRYTTADFVAHCLALDLSAAPVNSIAQVAAMDLVREHAVRTVVPGGREARLSPAAHGTAHLEKTGGTLPCAPRLGEHTQAVLHEIGLDAAEIHGLKEARII